MARRQEWKSSPDRAVLAEFEDWLEQKLRQLDPSTYSGTSTMIRTQMYHEHQAYMKCQIIIEAIRLSKSEPQETP